MKPARLSRRPRLKLTRAGPTRSEKKLRQLNYHNPARLGAKHMMAALILRTWFCSGANKRGLRTEPSPQDQCRHHVFCRQASWIVIVELSQFFLASCRSGACKFQPWAAGEPCRFHQRRARCLECSQIVYCE